MAVGASVLPAGDVDPEVLIVGGFEDELVGNPPYERKVISI